MRHDMYSGGEHFWIMMKNGTYCVMREGLPSEDFNHVVFSGHYDECLKCLDRIWWADRETEMDI